MGNLNLYPKSQGGWVKYEGNPVLGNKELGTCFDVQVLKEYGNRLTPQGKNEKPSGYRMYFSWRPKSSLAVTTSPDGITWAEPKVIFEPNPSSGWEENIDRSWVLEKDGVYHLWYTGQYHDNFYSKIGYAVSNDGFKWSRIGDEPVLEPERPWENMSVMLPCVHWDEDRKKFRMWYSCGESYEPNVICYAESGDGIRWIKHRANPVFAPDKRLPYEKQRVGGCESYRYRGGYLMFYIGYEDIDTARINMAWSPDGLTRWRRFNDNPIISPGINEWDGDACYKPSVVYDEDKNRWLLWYNGRHKAPEYIGMAVHEGEDLGI